MSKEIQNKCKCACHDTEWNSDKKHSPVEHDIKCCEFMNGNLKTQNKWEREFVEIGASLEHDRWSRWQKYLHSILYELEDLKNPHLKILPTELFNRWERQINTKYSELSEKEKESDREEVRKYLPIISRIETGAFERVKSETLEEVEKIIKSYPPIAIINSGTKIEEGLISKDILLQTINNMKE